MVTDSTGRRVRTALGAVLVVAGTTAATAFGFGSLGGSSIGSSGSLGSSNTGSFGSSYGSVVDSPSA